MSLVRNTNGCKFLKTKGQQWGVRTHIHMVKFGRIVSLPNEVAREDRTQRDYLLKHGSVMLVDYVKRELALKERIVVETEHWVALVPYWAIWPFETLLLPKLM